jgi:hypothetical protein
LLPLPSLIKGLTYRVYAATAGKRVVCEIQSGNSLKFVPSADLPNDLWWASGSPTAAQAFAGFASVMDEIGVAFLPEPVRHLVHERLQAWNGESMGISRRWVDDAVAQLNEVHQPTARLVLLTAFASYQVDKTVIHNFQSQHPEDAQLIAATAWASFAAARRVSVWLTS